MGPEWPDVTGLCGNVAGFSDERGRSMIVRWREPSPPAPIRVPLTTNARTPCATYSSPQYSSSPLPLRCPSNPSLSPRRTPVGVPQEAAGLWDFAAAS
jgi:hypothetical protein